MDRSRSGQAWNKSMANPKTKMSLKNSGHVKTLQTSTATIRISGAGSDSDTDSSQEEHSSPGIISNVTSAISRWSPFSFATGSHINSGLPDPNAVSNGVSIAPPDPDVESSQVSASNYKEDGSTKGETKSVVSNAQDTSVANSSKLQNSSRLNDEDYDKQTASIHNDISEGPPHNNVNNGSINPDISEINKSAIETGTKQAGISKENNNVQKSCDDIRPDSLDITSDVGSKGRTKTSAKKSNTPSPQRFNPFDKDNESVSDTVQSKSGSLNKRKNGGLLQSGDSGLQQSLSGSEEVSNAELGLAEDHFGSPEVTTLGHFGMSGLEELDMAIENCKLLIFEAPEYSERRKNLVNKLVQLRLKRQEAKDGPVIEEPDVKVVVGHRFQAKDTKSSKHYCEKCSSVIWGVLQTWYRCEGCGYSCHAKCLNLITRTCAATKVLESAHYILCINPEKGLSGQNYRCVECRRPISYKDGYAEPRQCDYTGAYFCEGCHWNDVMVIPGRVLHNWDFEQRKVARASKQYLRLMLQKPVLRINDINPMLFNFVEELNEVKKLREEILVMKRYFLTCKEALDSKLLLQLRGRQHFVDSSDMYSLQDLIDVAYDILLPEMAKVHTSFAQHIKTDCQLCQAKGYHCELCDMQEVLFPFDNIAIVCAKCSAVLHRHCFMRRSGFCPKCDRLSRRAVEDQGTSGVDS